MFLSGLPSSKHRAEGLGMAKVELLEGRARSSGHFCIGASGTFLSQGPQVM